MTHINENAWIYATLAGIRFRYDPTSGVVQRYFMSNKWETYRGNTRARNSIKEAILKEKDKNPSAALDALYRVDKRIPLVLSESRVNPEYILRSEEENIMLVASLFSNPAFESSGISMIQIAADMFVLKAEGIISLGPHYNLVYEGKESEKSTNWLVRYRGYIIHRGKRIDLDIECAWIKSRFGEGARLVSYFDIDWRHYIWEDPVDIITTAAESPSRLKEIDNQLTKASQRLDAWNKTLINSPKVRDVKTGIVYQDMDHALEAVVKDLDIAKKYNYARDTFNMVNRMFPGRLVEIKE